MKHCDKIMIVEDDAGIRHYLQSTLSNAGYDTVAVGDGRSALALAASHCPDCVLLDLGLPDMDGIGIIQSIRKWSSVPIIVISARMTEDDKAGALDLGADDYLTKPFGTVELLARIRTALRHTRKACGGEELREGQYIVGDLVIDYNKHRAYLGGEDAGLTPSEFKILALLGRYAGRVLTYQQMLRELWGPAANPRDNKLLRAMAKAAGEALAHGRPDAEDIAAAEAFARNAAHTLRERERPIPAAVPGREPIGPYYTPLGLNGEPARFLKAKPLTDPLKCARCGLCAALCPMGSIPRETPEECGGICIKCQACVKGCPTGAKYFADAAFCSHRAMLEQTYAKRRENEFFPPL